MAQPFGIPGAPFDLTQVQAMPGIDTNQMVGDGSGLNIMSTFNLNQQPDYMSMLAGLGGMGGQQQASPMPPAPSPHLQAGGEQFAMPYQYNPFQLQPTAQRLGGLLGNVYGTV